MAKSAGQKTKLLALLEILWRNTDEEHPMSTPELLKALAARGISAERKSLYSDLYELSEFGFEIEQVRGRSTGYYLALRPFELAELKLLVDAVQSSRFITEKKSASLISRLSSLVSRHEAKSLSRQVYTSGRVKTMNESIYYTVDEIHRAINADKKISFLYFSWDVEKNQVLRRDGERYLVSPFALLWEDENYYLVAFDEEKHKILHFRVDKMLRLSLSEEARTGRELFEKTPLSEYSRRVFGMFGGEEKNVTLKLSEGLVGVILDRFGRDVPILRGESGTFSVVVPVTVSPQFFGWLASLGKEASLVSPPEVKDEYVRYLKDTLKAQE